jgi:putative transposase
MGQSYKLSVNLEKQQAEFLFRYPDAQGVWQWSKTPTILTLPDIVCEHLKTGKRMAPTLREHVRPDGTHIAVLDFIVQVKKAKLPDWNTVERVLGFDWGVHTLLTMSVLDEQYDQVSRPWFLQTDGFDAKQARTRRQIDQLKARVAFLPPDHDKQLVLEREIARCWRKYENRNHELGHLAANVILLLASVYRCQLISGESLSTLKTVGRGKGAKGRWRNWRNNTTIRSEIWKVLRYKAHLVGIRFRSEHPRGTSHTCPRCHTSARTFRSPRREHRKDPIDWGRWLVCEHCGYNADRDYCASLNIARLGVAYLLQTRQTRKAWSFKMTDPSVKSSRYTPEAATLLLPSPTRSRSRSPRGEKLCSYPGWARSVALCSSYSADVVFRLCGVG